MPPNLGLGMQLRGRTLGIWGYGQDRPVVGRLRPGVGMKVCVWGSEIGAFEGVADGFALRRAAEAFFETVRALAALCGCTKARAETRQVDALARMKTDALMVNTCVAELIEERVWSRRLKRAPGLDAVVCSESEAIRQGHPLLRSRNDRCTPQSASRAGQYELYRRRIRERRQTSSMARDRRCSIGSARVLRWNDRPRPTSTSVDPRGDGGGWERPGARPAGRMRSSARSVRWSRC